MKIKILFVIESLALAGSEKSLIALLANLDPQKYEIDLQLFKYGCELERFLPEYVNCLPPLSYTLFAKKKIFETLKIKYLKFLIPKFLFSAVLRLRKRNHTEIAKIYWGILGKSYTKSKVQYDVAIAFAQGIPTFYVVDNVSATKKIAWVNAHLELTTFNINFQKKYYDRLDVIVNVSENISNHMNEMFDDMNTKLTIIPNIIDYKSVVQLAGLYKTSLKGDKFNILTVGRLDDGMKGMDITINACKHLSHLNLDFHWYIIGEGHFENDMISFIKENKLETYLTLLGTTDNPYPYFREADLYVQTSRSEGYGRSIAEARLLNLPIVTTRYDTVHVQMSHEVNGLITDIDAQAVADAIDRMMHDQELYASVRSYLKIEKKENDESINKFDILISELLDSL